MIVYTIELDVDPVTLGFDPKEVTRKEDGTYVVTRRFVHAVHRYSNIYGNSYELEAYCPCSTDNVVILTYEIVDTKGRTTYGTSYWLNGQERRDYESRSLNNSMMNYWHPITIFNRMYDTHIEDKEQEKAASFCVSQVNRHPNNTNSQLQRDYFDKYHIVFQQSPPTSPQKDPFLPEKFKQMLNNS